MNTLNVNGARFTAGSITFGRFGTWAADLEMANDEPIAEGARKAVVVFADLEATGTVIRQANFASDRKARLVGGGAGWRKVLEPKGYSHPQIGVTLSTVLTDVASSCDETIAGVTDRVLGTHWGRVEGKAESVLSILTNGEWWMDLDGVTRFDARSSGPIVTPFTMITGDGARGQFRIAAEMLASWQPGRTFQTVNIPEPQTISSVTITASNDGTVEMHVLTDVAGDRLRGDIRSIVRAELASLLFAATWEYQVAPSLGMPGLSNTIDCTPIDRRMPPLTNVPIRCIGAVTPPLAGTKCRIRFVNMDPGKPECVGVEGMTEHLITTEATALLIYNVLSAMGTVTPGPWLGASIQPTITAAIVAAITAQGAPAPPGLVAQIPAAAAGAAAMVAGTAPSLTASPFASLIQTALAAKTVDVSGQFPSVGVPNG